MARTLRQAGFEAYFAGGCVRDLLLGVTPKDYDVVTDARPDQISGLFRRTFQVGAAFGVVQVLWSGVPYEVATYRKDGVYLDGRHPESVEYSDSKEEDVQRRDFTINALLMDPETGQVLDWVEGLSDLRAGRIRAVGDPVQRFSEDRLRMLRAVRFSVRFDFSLEDRTAQAIRGQAGALHHVSEERILAELDAMMGLDDPSAALLRLEDLRLAVPALPFLPEEESARRHLYGQLQQGFRTDEPLRTVDHLAVAWAVLFDSAKPAHAEGTLRQMKHSRERIRSVLELLRARPVLDAPDRHRPAALARRVADPRWPKFRTYARARGNRLALERAEALRTLWTKQPLPARPLLTGGDLKELGWKPGPRFKEVLQEVDDRVLEGRIKSRDEALAFIQEPPSS